MGQQNEPRWGLFKQGGSAGPAFLKLLEDLERDRWAGICFTGCFTSCFTSCFTGCFTSCFDGFLKLLEIWRVTAS